MRIVHVISRFNRGGTASWLKILITEQRRLGHEVFLLAGYVQDDEEEDPFFSTLDDIRISTLGRKINLFSDILAIFQIRKTIIHLNPDLVNTHTFKAGVVGRIGVRLAFKKRIALVHTYHGHLLYGYFNNFAKKVFIILESLLSRITDLLLVSGEQVKLELINSGISESSKYFSVRPGVEITLTPKASKNSEQPVIGWLGRLTDIKRPERVLELAEILPEVEFLIAGEGAMRNTLENDCPTNVKFVGWVNPNEFWPKCDIALLTSDNEAQPISLIEAAMFGLPVVAEDVGSVSEVVKDGKTGFLVNGYSERIKALKKLLSDPILRKNMSVESIKYANGMFGIAQFIENHEKAYKIAILTRLDGI